MDLQTKIKQSIKDLKNIEGSIEQAKRHSNVPLVNLLIENKTKIIQYTEKLARAYSNQNPLAQ